MPNIIIKWGCFHKDTLIKMADGSEKKISEIIVGDMVRTAGQQNVMVTETCKGPEAKLVGIQTKSGKVLQLTENHPVLSEHGKTVASGIVITSKIHTEDGLEEITEVSLVDYDDQVYNVDCNGEMLIANGIYAGDFVSQNAMKKREIKRNHTPEVAAILEDMKRMSADINRAHHK